MFRAASIAIITLLLISQLYQCFASPLSIDDAWIADYAKNWAGNEGFGLTIYDRFLPFHNTFYSPIVFFVGMGTLAIKIFGNSYWAPALAVVIATQLFVISSLFALRRIPELKDQFWKASLVLVVLWLLCSTGDYNHRHEHTFLWYSFHGDVLSGLSLLLAALLMAGGGLTNKRLLLVSFVLALASQIKLLTLLPAAVICAGLLWKEYRAHSLKRAVWAGFMLALMPILFQASWLLYVFYTLGAEHFWQLEQASTKVIGIVAGNGAQIDKQHFPVCHIECTEKLALVWTHVGLIFLPALMWVMFRLWRKGKGGVPVTRSEFIGSLLVLAGIVQMLWWIKFSIPLTRYLAPALMYVATGMALILLQRKSIYPYGLYIMLATALLGRSDSHNMAWFKEPFAEHTELGDMLGAKEKLEQLHKDGYELSSCGINFELEYLLPGSGHFVPCETLRGSDKKFAVALSYIAPDLLVGLKDEGMGTFFIDKPQWVVDECRVVQPSSRFAVFACPQ